MLHGLLGAWVIAVIITFPRAARLRYLPPSSAWAAWVSGSSPKVESPPRSPTEAIQLENVVRRADQRPFALYLFESPQQELPEATGLLDLTNHRFDDRFAPGINPRARLGVQLAGHPVDDRRGLRQGAVRTGPRPFAMALLPRRDVRVDGPGRDPRQVRVRAIAGVGEQLCRRVARLLRDGGDHRQQLPFVVRLLRHGLAHDQLQIVHRDLDVVGLDEAVGALHDPRL